MTAAQVTDGNARLPRCAKQAADAVFANTRIKMEDAPKFPKILQGGVSRHLDTSVTTRVAQIVVVPGWRDEYTYRSKTVPMTAKCKRLQPGAQHSPEWQH